MFAFVMGKCLVSLLSLVPDKRAALSKMKLCEPILDRPGAKELHALSGLFVRWCLLTGQWERQWERSKW